jgi:hypothetical protein
MNRNEVLNKAGLGDLLDASIWAHERAPGKLVSVVCVKLCKMVIR